MKDIKETGVSTIQLYKSIPPGLVFGQLTGNQGAQSLHTNQQKSLNSNNYLWVFYIILFCFLS